MQLNDSMSLVGERGSGATNGTVEPAAGLPLRFAWQSDEDGRLVDLTPDPVRRFGGQSPLGLCWEELIRRLNGADGERLALALSRRDTWSGVVVDWPFGAAPAVVELSGLPLFDRARVFKGFRGFGLMRAQEPQAAPPASDGPGTEPAPAREPPGPEIPEPSPGPEPTPAPPPPAPEIPEPSPEPDSPEPAPGIPEPAPPPSPPEPPPDMMEPPSGRVLAFPSSAPRPALEPGDRSAFQEIARALGRAGSRSCPSADAPLLAAALPEPERLDGPDPSSPAFGGRAGPAAALDALPVAVLVHRLGAPIYANRSFFDLVEIEDLASLAAYGVDSLFAHPLLPRDPVLRLRTGAGRMLRVHAHLKTLVWDGEPASLLVLRVPDPAPAAEADEPHARARSAEEALRELRTILDAAVDGVVMLDDAGRVLTLNGGAERLFGYGTAELAGRSFTLLLAADSHLAALDRLAGLRATGAGPVENGACEVRGVARHGGTVPLLMTAVRIGTPSEPRFCVLLQDFTRFKDAEEELRAAQRKAERASAQKSDFLTAMSHEIRTPLNAMLGFSELMIEERFGPIGNERYAGYLRDIQASGSHVISLVDDLLDLAKIEAGRLDLDFASVALNEVVASSVALLQPEAARGRVIVRSSLARELPGVTADPRSLRQIVLNLLSNAVKFTPAGGQVIVSTAVTGRGEAALRVRDTGKGMTAEEIQIALEPFRQLSTAGAARGTGLGLPLTRALVEANRARFSIQSDIGGGTLVEVVFPPNARPSTGPG